jgi:TFIIF-interacting CTD phosphatase-like protein
LVIPAIDNPKTLIHSHSLPIRPSLAIETVLFKQAVARMRENVFSIYKKVPSLYRLVRFSGDMGNRNEKARCDVIRRRQHDLCSGPFGSTPLIRGPDLELAAH